MNRFLPILSALALAVSACWSDGGNGELELVRFSLVSDFVATDGLDHPVAAGGTLMIALQRPERSGIPDVVDPPTFTTLKLEARAVSGPAPIVYPAGIAQYGVYFPGAGEARLVATEDGKDLDWFKVTIVKPSKLSLEHWGAATFDGSDDGVCASLRDVDPADYRLPPNAALYGHVVPYDGAKPLIGLLQLTVESVGTGPAELDATLIGQARPAHAFQVIRKPGADTLDDIELRVTDSANALEVRQVVRVRADDEEANCN